MIIRWTIPQTFQFDAAGRRTRLTWADGFYDTYGYDTANELTSINENGATASGDVFQETGLVYGAGGVVGKLL